MIETSSAPAPGSAAGFYIWPRLGVLRLAPPSRGSQGGHSGDGGGQPDNLKGWVRRESAAMTPQAPDWNTVSMDRCACMGSILEPKAACGGIRPWGRPCCPAIDWEDACDPHMIESLNEPVMVVGVRISRKPRLRTLGRPCAGPQQEGANYER